MKYTIVRSRTIDDTVVVEADSPEEARKKAVAVFFGADHLLPTTVHSDEATLSYEVFEGEDPEEGAEEVLHVDV